MGTIQSDFVQIQLSAAGAELAGKGGVRMANGHFAYKFAPGVPVKVLTSEWANVLSKKRIKGLLIFEEVPKPAAAPAAPTTAATPAPAAAAPEPKAADDTPLSKLKAQEAEIKAEEEALQSKGAKVGTK